MRYNVFPHPSGLGYLLDVQTDIMQPFNTRVVVPLLRLEDAPMPAATLNPVFDIDGVPHVVVTQYMAAVPAGETESPPNQVRFNRLDISHPNLSSWLCQGDKMSTRFFLIWIHSP